VSDAIPDARREGRAASLVALAAIGLLAGLARLWALGVAAPDRLQPDEAHVLNVARCFARGQGFSNVEAWPAWLAPEKLPTPETFKEPGYSKLISILAGRGADLRGPGLALSLGAGLLVPWLVWALGRRLDPDPRVAFAAGLLAAGSPLLIEHSVWIVVESLFTLVVAAAFLVALPRAGVFAPVNAPGGDRRPILFDLLAGALFGAAYLLRAQVVIAAPALLWALCLGRPRREIARALPLAAVAALAVMSPLLMRNLRLFGVPFFSNVTAYGIWPYVDHFQFSHGLERPPAPLAFALSHLPQVARHWIRSSIGFATGTLPEVVLGNPLWALPFAAGVALALARWRRLGFVLLYPVLTLAFIFAVNWAPYYFTSITPYVCLITALGAVWIWRALASVSLVGPLRGSHLLAMAVLLTLTLQAHAARREVAGVGSPELEAARAEAPVLRARLGSDEAVLCLTTSYWAWFADRPAVHWIMADEPMFDAAMRRLKVRVAALPTSQLPLLASRSPGGRLPGSLVLDHVDPARDVTVFTIADSAGRIR
jgi:hypothetical protein